jgi:hypothetical protein
LQVWEIGETIFPNLQTIILRVRRQANLIGFLHTFDMYGYNVIELIERLSSTSLKGKNMEPLRIVLDIHSVVRWIVVAVSLIALVWFGLVWLRGLRNEKADRGLMSAFSGLVDLQVAIGLVYILWSGFAGAGFPRYRVEHAAAMILAAIVAHLSVRWRKAETPERARNNVGLIAGVLVIVFIGVSLLPQGWLD